VSSGKQSAGLLLYRLGKGRIEVLIAHMGGPFWAKKDAFAWSIPKGEYEEGDDLLAVARREFAEELGSPAPEGRPLELGTVRQPSGKKVPVFALEGDFDPSRVVSNEFETEWPRGSGQTRSFPEIDRAEWLTLDEARSRLVKGQHGFLDLLQDMVRRTST
jgi:predicted NUDIX family NTP pyrophosphohydrolase